MMNKNFKIASIAGVMGLVIGSATVGMANSYIQATLNNTMKVTLNGVVQEFRDETTNELQYPIIYKDRTYLPLRTVANLVGLGIDWDQSTGTVILVNDDVMTLDNDYYKNVFCSFIFKNKYAIIMIKEPYNSGMNSVIKIIDGESNEQQYGIYYDEQKQTYAYQIDENRIIVSEYVRTDGNISICHRVDYELVEENGKLVKRVLNEDFNDIKHTAAT